MVSPASIPVLAAPPRSITRAAISIAVPRSIAVATARSSSGASATRSRATIAGAAALSRPAVSAGGARRALPADHRDFNAVAATEDSHSNRFTDPCAAEPPDERLGRGERPGVDADEDVAVERARALRRPAGLEAVHEQPTPIALVGVARAPDAHRMRAEAEVAARHPPADEQLVDHRRHEIDRQRE